MSKKNRCLLMKENMDDDEYTENVFGRPIDEMNENNGGQNESIQNDNPILVVPVSLETNQTDKLKRSLLKTINSSSSSNNISNKATFKLDLPSLMFSATSCSSISSSPWKGECCNDGDKNDDHFKNGNCEANDNSPNAPVVVDCSFPASKMIASENKNSNSNNNNNYVDSQSNNNNNNNNNDEQLISISRMDEESNIERLKNVHIDDNNVINWQDNEDFRKISLYPEKSDLSSGDDGEYDNKSMLLLRPILIRGSYVNVNHYLDTHIGLLRADFLSCLRNGIGNYMANMINPDFQQCSADDENNNNGVRIYRNVKFVDHYSKGSEYGYTIKLNPTTTNGDAIAIATNNKRLVHRSLLVFTADNFTNFFVAVVMENARLKNGLLDISFTVGGHDIPVSDKDRQEFFSREYVMAEPVTFFEPYFCVMKSLRAFDQTNFPMKKYIVDVAVTFPIPPPAYIRAKPNLQLKENNIVVDIRDRTSWPSAADLNLDEHQFTAFVGALTREFAMIQGPPGTGKTFLGLKLISTILENFDPAILQSPIIVVSATNFAVDQFLEGILKYTDDIRRIGCQSKSEIIQRYNLRCLSSFKVKNHDRISDAEYGYLCSDIKATVEQLNGIRKFERKLIERSCIISVYSLYQFMSVRQRRWFSSDIDFLNWLINNDQSIVDHRWSVGDCGFEKNSAYISLAYDRCKTSSYLDKLSEAKMRQQNLEVETVDSDIMEPSEYIRYVAGIFDKNLAENRDAINDECSSSTHYYYEHPPHLVPEKIRWQLYHKWTRQLYDKLITDERDVRTIYAESVEKRDRMKRCREIKGLKSARVVGMTTSGAARNRELLQELKPKIVLVDEAAEILESHVLASLSNSCEHLIMIGDHQQLKPAVASYKLAKDYHLNVSLFERMINNGMPCPRLNRQHRMRPEIVTLISDNIYSGLENDSSVNKFENVFGMFRNMFFITHTSSEDANGSSFSNMHEAAFVIELCRYLIFQNYSPDEITILTTYSGQLNLLFQLKKEYPTLKNVLMCTLDSYQGKENKLILLSLVRSNTNGDIGFLAMPNRVCVALSRAKHGLYMIGDMKCLSAKNTLWQKIERTLVKKQAIGEHLILACRQHRTKMPVRLPIDIQRVICDDNCLQRCGVALKCGHICERLCHIEDQEHKLSYTCSKLCQNELPANHPHTYFMPEHKVQGYIWRP